MSQKLPFRKALWLIFFWTLLCSGSAYLCWATAYYFTYSQKSDKRYQLSALLLHSCQGEAFPPHFFSETLHLSVENLPNLFHYDILNAKKMLLSHPAIENVHIQRYSPNALLIEYASRIPVALLADINNLAIDKNGAIFPLYPLYTPKSLPEIFLGMTVEQLNSFCQNKLANSELQKKLEFALSLIEKNKSAFSEVNLVLKWIDVSKVDENSLGQQQLVVGAYNPSFPGSNLLYFRLMPQENLIKFLHYYQLLSPCLLCYHDKNRDAFTFGIDMRLPPLAYIIYGEIL